MIPTKSVGVIEAEKARLIKKQSSDKKRVDRLLKPIFKKIDKAASSGLSEVALFKPDWAKRDRLVYQQAVLKLESLGYVVRNNYDYNYGGYYITISWD